MKQRRRTLAVLAATTLLALAGCGGSEDDLATASDAARGGKLPAASASITVTPSVTSIGQDLTISLYPGSYADQRLFLNWICYQNGAQVSHDGTYELHEAVSFGIPGYAFLGDHYDWTFTFSSLQSYTGGAASCEVIGWYVNRKSQWIKIAGGTFQAQ